MVDRDVIKEWITKADEDFEFARLNLEEERRFFAQICFHFHQAGEKYLKAFIIANALEFRKIHDLLSIDPCGPAGNIRKRIAQTVTAPNVLFPKTVALLVLLLKNLAPCVVNRHVANAATIRRSIFREFSLSFSSICRRPSVRGWIYGAATNNLRTLSDYQRRI